MKKADYLKALIDGGALPEDTNINDFLLDELKEKYDQMISKETKDETENPIEEPVIVKPLDPIKEVEPVINIGFHDNPWRLLCKSSCNDGDNVWTKDTRGLQLSPNHILIQVTTTDKNGTAVALTSTTGRLIPSTDNEKIYVIGN